MKQKILFYHKKLVFVLVMFCLSIVHHAQTAPSITYAGVIPNYYVNKTSLNLAPTNSGGAVTLTQYWLTTLAGSTQGSADGQGTSAQFYFPSGVAVDANGNVYVADEANNKIRKITPAGTVTTLAGSGTNGDNDGPGTSAEFYNPSGVAVDANGNVYVADTWNSKIRKITPDGNVTTFAGSGILGHVDGPVSSAQFNFPSGVAIDTNGDIYVADSGNHKIRKITSNGTVNTLAGSGTQGYIDGSASSAQFSYPTGVAVDINGNVYVADYYNSTIRVIASNGTVTSLAGNGTAGSIDGQGPSAQFALPSEVTVDLNGNVYVADSGNNKIRMIAPNGNVTTFAGSDTRGYIDGSASSAQFSAPYGVALDVNGNLYIADKNNHKIRIINKVNYSISPNLPNGLSFDTATGIISGIPTAISPSITYTITSGNASGTSSTTVTFSTTYELPNTSYPTAVSDYCVTNPISIAPTETAGNPVSIELVSTLAGSTSGDLDGPGASAQFANPYGTAVDASGNVYVADYNNHKIRKITPDGTVSTLAGSTSGDLDGPGTSAQFKTPYGIAVDASGIVYVTDSNQKIKKIATDGTVTTLAGNGTAGFTDGPGSSAQFNAPIGVAVDASSNVYVADYNNHKIRKIATDGTVTTLAGSGVAGSVDGIGGSAQFNYPIGIAVDASGTIYVTDQGNNKIRKIAPDGTVTTWAGDGNSGSTDGPGASAQFKDPVGIAVDASGNVYVADKGNNKIRKIATDRTVTTLAGNGTAGFTDGYTSSAQFDFPIGVAVDASRNVYVADFYNDKIRKITSIIGYTVSPVLPTGLAIDPISGVISGTPSITTPSTVYTIVSSNQAGSFSTTVTFAINAIPDAPVGTSPQNATATGTLADLTLTGTNLKWYDSAVSTTPLSTATPLVSGTSYYASQTVNGCESNSRFGVLVDVVLGTQHLEMQNISFYPNPTKDLFHVNSPEPIIAIHVYNNLGQIVLDKKFNSKEVTIDCSGLSSGIYYLSVTSEKGTKKIKVIKD
jgi:sugar lactone lactonase YvrE